MPESSRDVTGHRFRSLGGVLREGLSQPVWQGVAAVAAIAALTLAVIQIVNRRESQPSANVDARSDSARDVTIDGVDGCVAVLTDETICEIAVPMERTDFETVTVAPNEHMQYIVPTPVDELGTPPSYPVSQLRGHCEIWEDWLQSQSAYTGRPGLGLFMASGEANQIVVQSVAVEVIERHVFDHDYAYVVCQHGAGSTWGYGIDVHTQDPSATTLTDYDTGESSQMPPAALVLNGLDYDGAAIGIQSDECYLYEGVVRISYLSSGDQREIVYGSVDTPYQWVSSSCQDELASMPAVDWDLERGSWVGVDELFASLDGQ